MINTLNNIIGIVHRKYTDAGPSGSRLYYGTIYIFTLPKFSYFLFNFFFCICYFYNERLRSKKSKRANIFIGLVFIKSHFTRLGPRADKWDIIFFQEALNFPIFTKTSMDTRKNNINT